MSAVVVLASDRQARVGFLSRVVRLRMRTGGVLHRTARSASRAVYACLLAFTAANCAPGSRITVEGRDPIIVTHRSTVTLTAEIHGVLRYDPLSRCLRISLSGASPALPVWTAGTKPVYKEGRRGVDVPNVGLILEGDRVVGVGGASAWRSHPPSGVKLPDGCLLSGPDGTALILARVTQVVGT